MKQRNKGEEGKKRKKGNYTREKETDKWWEQVKLKLKKRRKEKESKIRLSHKNLKREGGWLTRNGLFQKSIK